MIPKFKIGDLVQYEMYDTFDADFPIIEGDALVYALITGFYDHETGQRLTSDYTTHDTVIEVSVDSNAGSTRILMHDLELLSSAEAKSC
jgi:hypothetical protein